MFDLEAYRAEMSDSSMIGREVVLHGGADKFGKLCRQMHNHLVWEGREGKRVPVRTNDARNQRLFIWICLEFFHTHGGCRFSDDTMYFYPNIEE